MIDGVNLITTETICISGSFLGNLFPAIIGVVGCVAAIVVAILCAKEEEWGVFLFGLSMGFVLALVAFFCFKDAFNPRYEERYMVQLKEEVPLDFIKNYEILEDKGNDIYIVREKGNE